MTERLFLDASAAQTASARVISASPAAIILDRTIFYARSGGQPGDVGTMTWDGGTCPIIDTSKGEGETILHHAAPDTPLPADGTEVTLTLDWPRRHKLMRMHSAMHLLCALLPGASVTGGAVGWDKSRLDFDLTPPPGREEIEAGLNQLVAADHPITTEWVDESVLDTNPEMVRTLSVKPPRGTGRIRLVRIGAGETPIDLQPCGGTHVASTAEIGRLAVTKIENKGKQNRRIIITLA